MKNFEMTRNNKWIINDINTFFFAQILLISLTKISLINNHDVYSSLYLLEILINPSISQ